MSFKLALNFDAAYKSRAWCESLIDTLRIFGLGWLVQWTSEGRRQIPIFHR